MLSSEEMLAMRRNGGTNQMRGFFTDRKMTTIPQAIASGEITTTIEDILREVHNADS